MGICHNEGFRRRNSITNTKIRKTPSDVSEKESDISQLYEKKDGKITYNKVNTINYNNKDTFT